MPFIPLIATVLFLALNSAAQAKNSVDVIPKVVSTRAAPYAAISFVTEGPAHSLSDGDVRGKFQRLVLLSLGLAYDRPTLRLETLTYGDEACCRKVVAAWELDLNELSGSRSTLPDAATNELRFVRWRGPRTAEFRYGEFTCKFQGIGLPKVKVACDK